MSDTIQNLAAPEPTPDGCAWCGAHVSEPHSPACGEHPDNRIVANKVMVGLMAACAMLTPGSALPGALRDFGRVVFTAPRPVREAAVRAVVCHAIASGLVSPDTDNDDTAPDYVGALVYGLRAVTP